MQAGHPLMMRIIHSSHCGYFLKAGDIRPVTINIANRLVLAVGNITAADDITMVTGVTATTLSGSRQTNGGRCADLSGHWSNHFHTGR